MRTHNNPVEYLYQDILNNILALPRSVSQTLILEICEKLPDIDKIFFSQTNKNIHQIISHNLKQGKHSFLKKLPRSFKALVIDDINASIEKCDAKKIHYLLNQHLNLLISANQPKNSQSDTIYQSLCAETFKIACLYLNDFDVSLQNFIQDGVFKFDLYDTSNLKEASFYTNLSQNIISELKRICFYAEKRVIVGGNLGEILHNFKILVEESHTIDWLYNALMHRKENIINIFQMFIRHCPLIAIPQLIFGHHNKDIVEQIISQTRKYKRIVPDLEIPTKFYRWIATQLQFLKNYPNLLTQCFEQTKRSQELKIIFLFLPPSCQKEIIQLCCHNNIYGTKDAKAILKSIIQCREAFTVCDIFTFNYVISDVMPNLVSIMPEIENSDFYLAYIELAISLAKINLMQIVNCPANDWVSYIQECEADDELPLPSHLPLIINKFTNQSDQDKMHEALILTGIELMHIPTLEAVFKDCRITCLIDVLQGLPSDAAIKFDFFEEIYKNDRFRQHEQIQNLILSFAVKNNSLPILDLLFKNCESISFPMIMQQISSTTRFTLHELFAISIKHNKFDFASATLQFHLTNSVSSFNNINLIYFVKSSKTYSNYSMFHQNFFLKALLKIYKTIAPTQLRDLCSLILKDKILELKQKFYDNHFETKPEAKEWQLIFEKLHDFLNVIECLDDTYIIENKRKITFFLYDLSLFHRETYIERQHATLNTMINSHCQSGFTLYSKTSDPILNALIPLASAYHALCHPKNLEKSKMIVFGV